MKNFVKVLTLIMMVAFIATIGCLSEKTILNEESNVIILDGEILIKKSGEVIGPDGIVLLIEDTKIVSIAPNTVVSRIEGINSIYDITLNYIDSIYIPHNPLDDDNIGFYSGWRYTPGEGMHYYSNGDPCFIEDTNISLSDGSSIKIEELMNRTMSNKLIKVASGSEYKQNFINYPTVKEVKENIFYITVSCDNIKNTIGLTKEHTLKAKSGYIQAQDIKIGDRVLTTDGIGAVIDIEIKKYMGKVYNFNIVENPYKNYIKSNESEWYKETNFGLTIDKHYFYANNIAIGDMYVQHSEK